MAVLLNMYNKCPVMAVPSGRASSGVPTGIQVIGRPFDDQTVFRIAKAFENEKPWLDCAERRPVLEPKLSVKSMHALVGALNYPAQLQIWME